MNATMTEIDNELGAALTTTAGIISLLDGMQEREAFRELEGLFETMSLLFYINGSHPACPVPETFERTLSMMISAHESRSWLLLADILRYEVTPLLKNWKASAKEFRLTAAGGYGETDDSR